VPHTTVKHAKQMETLWRQQHPAVKEQQP
jgi:hypothetical protein